MREKRMRTWGLFLCALASSPGLAQAQATDQGWTRFRGPNGSGVATAANPPVQLDMQRNLRWKASVPTGHSSPVMSGDQIFLTANEGDQLLTLCLDRQTGREQWRRTAPRARHEKLDPRNNPASPSPVVDDLRVYVFFPDFGLLAYTHSGELEWQLPLGPFDNLYGMGASPVLADDLVVLVCDQNTGSFLVAVNKDTGQQAWQVARPEATSGHCTPIVYRPESGPPQILVPGSFFLTAYDASDGAKKWWVGGLCFEMKSTPVMSSDTVYINGYGSPANQPGQQVTVPTFDETLSEQDKDRDGAISLDEMPEGLGKSFFPAVDLDASGAMNRAEWDYYRAALASKNGLLAIRVGGDGELTDSNVRWSYHRNIPQLPSPLLYGDLLFMVSDSGIVTCLDASSGEVRHRGRLPGAEGNMYASPVAADGRLYFVTERGQVVVTGASAELELLAVSDMGERCYATPMIAGDAIWVRTTAALYCFEQP